MTIFLIIVLLWGGTLIYVKTKVIPAAVDDTFKKVAVPYFEQLLLAHRQAMDAKFDFRDEAMIGYAQAIVKLEEAVDNLYATDGRPQAPQPIITANVGKRAAAPVIIEQEASPKAVGPNTVLPDDGLPLNKHVFVTGQTGKGKSTAAKIGIMHRIVAGHELHIIDSKKELSQLFKRHASIYAPEQATDIITQLVTLADERAQLFDSIAEQEMEPCADIYDYEEITGIKLPIVSLVIEELLVITELIDHSVLKKLLALGRSSGVFCYALAQRANNDVIPSVIMANFQVRVYLGAYDVYAAKSMFPGGVPANIKRQLDSHLGPVGKALVYNDDNFQLTTFPNVSRELLKQFM